MSEKTSVVKQNLAKSKASDLHLARTGEKAVRALRDASAAFKREHKSVARGRFVTRRAGN